MLNEKETAGKTAAKVYTFNQFDHELRVGEINGEPWFVAKDVAQALNITWSSHTLDQIPEDWKGRVKFTTPGGPQDLTVISEAGLYKLAFRCQSSEIADAFTNKVASEILPSIRKTGRYEVGQSASGGRAVARHPRRSRNEKVNAELMNLLWLIGESLLPGEQKAVALELGVSRQTVYSVLNGYSRNARVLMALYSRARANRACGMLYYEPKVMAERLVAAEGGEVVVQLPSVVYGNRKRGGQPGNRNASRSWRKEGK